jgi:hypothetical protein
MHGAGWRAAAVLVLAQLVLAQTKATPLPQTLLSQTETSVDAYTAADLLQALNCTAGSTAGLLIWLRGECS